MTEGERGGKRVKELGKKGKERGRRRKEGGRKEEEEGGRRKKEEEGGRRRRKEEGGRRRKEEGGGEEGGRRNRTQTRMSDDDVSKQRKTCLPHEGRSLARQMFFARTSMRGRGSNQKALGTCKIHGEDR